MEAGGQQGELSHPTPGGWLQTQGDQMYLVNPLLLYYFINQAGRRKVSSSLGNSPANEKLTTHEILGILRQLNQPNKKNWENCHLELYFFRFDMSPYPLSYP